VDFDAYAHTAVEIVNSPMDTWADLVAFLGEDSCRAQRLTDRDLCAFRRARRRLREVFEHGSAGRALSAADELNALLETYPVRPMISGDETEGWQIQVTGRGSSVSAECLAGAVWGLAGWLCEYGSCRFGVCADERCRQVYLDTSSNRCRRFCSERCATRAHVAAHRARKKLSENAGGDPLPDVVLPVDC
jgi:predicted RNA-binding Zn ribbon-like protein